MSGAARGRPPQRLSDADYLARMKAAPVAPASRELGLEPLAVNVSEMWFEGAFNPNPNHLNRGGIVHGGFVTAMLDEVMGVAIISANEFRKWPPTLEIKAQFLRPVLPGRIIGRGQVIKMGRTIAFVSGELRDLDGELLATATCTSTLREFAHPALPGDEG